MSSVVLTERQQEIFDFIANFIEKNGYSPSFREIGKGCYIASTSTVAGHVDRLVRKGVIEYIPSTPRTLTPKK